MIQSIDVETLIKQAAEYFRLGDAELASDSCEFAQLSIRAACAEHAHTLRRFENYRNVEMKKIVSNEGYVIVFAEDDDARILNESRKYLLVLVS